MGACRLTAAVLATLVLFATVLHAHATPAFETPIAPIAATANSGCGAHHAVIAGGASACANAQACPFCAPAGADVSADRLAARAVDAPPQKTAAGLNSTPPRPPPKLFF